jgi:plastocyanin
MWLWVTNLQKVPIKIDQTHHFKLFPKKAGPILEQICRPSIIEKTSMKFNRSILFKNKRALVATVLLAGLVNVIQGATVTVDIVGYSFSPPSITIHVGDTVTWSGLANLHNVTGTTTQDLDQFCGPSLSSVATESSCSQTFLTAGSFPYECTIHGPCCGMTGLVTVVAATPTPTVSITNPVGGAVFSAPANLRVGATAAVSNGTVTNVAFFAGAILLGSAAASPFGITVSNLVANPYAFTAVATAAGVSATSAVVNITVVTPVAVSNSLAGLAGGQFSFDYTANPGLTYVVKSSSNLINWLPIGTNVPSSSPVIFTDTSALGAQRFYQVVRQPNP